MSVLSSIAQKLQSMQTPAGFTGVPQTPSGIPDLSSNQGLPGSKNILKNWVFITILISSIIAVISWGGTVIYLYDREEDQTSKQNIQAINSIVFNNVVLILILCSIFGLFGVLSMLFNTASIGFLDKAGNAFNKITDIISKYLFRGKK